MKFGLIGTFDVENYGDCMFPELYAHFLRERFGESDVVLFSPRPVAAKILSFGSVRALPAHEDRTALATLDADKLVLIGGETIGTGHSAGTYNFARSTLSAYLRLWLAPILAARCTGLRPNFFAAHSVGAIRMPDEINRDVARCLAAADRVRFRDNFSAEYVRDEDIGFAVDIDPMFLIDHLLPLKTWQERARAILPEGLAPERYLVAQLSIGYGANEMNSWVAAVTDIARMQNLPVVLVPICHFLEDERLLARLMPMLEANGLQVHLATGLHNVKDTAALVGQSAGYIGSSLHGAVTAVAFARPLAALGHAPDGKHVGTLASVGLTGLVATRNAELPSCFAKALIIDWTAARGLAQALARASIDGLLDALENSSSEARPKGLDAAASRLIAYERCPDPVYDAKRLALRAVRMTPGLSTLYRQWRIWKLFRGL